MKVGTNSSDHYCEFLGVGLFIAYLAWWYHVNRESATAAAKVSQAQHQVSMILISSRLTSSSPAAAKNSCLLDVLLVQHSC